MAKGNTYKKQNAQKGRRPNTAFKEEDGTSRAMAVRKEVL